MSTDIEWGERVVKMMIFLTMCVVFQKTASTGETAVSAVDRRSTRNSTTRMSR